MVIKENEPLTPFQQLFDAVRKIQDQFNLTGQLPPGFLSPMGDNCLLIMEGVNNTDIDIMYLSAQALEKALSSQEFIQISEFFQKVIQGSEDNRFTPRFPLIALDLSRRDYLADVLGIDRFILVEALSQNPYWKSGAILSFFGEPAETFPGEDHDPHSYIELVKKAWPEFEYSEYFYHQHLYHLVLPLVTVLAEELGFPNLYSKPTPAITGLARFFAEFPVSVHQSIIKESENPSGISVQSILFTQNPSIIYSGGALLFQAINEVYGVNTNLSGQKVERYKGIFDFLRNLIQSSTMLSETPISINHLVFDVLEKDGNLSEVEEKLIDLTERR